jgi:hypothetical protein
MAYNVWSLSILLGVDIKANPLGAPDELRMGSG